MPENVYLLGGARTDFKRNFKKEGSSLASATSEVVRAALARTGVAPRDVQAGVVGNFAGGLFTRQLHVGALLLEAHPDLRGIPTLHTEAACASGSLAVLTAAQWIAAGLYDCVLAVGVEQQKTMSPSDGSDVLAAAADYHAETPRYGEFTFPKLFGRIAALYMEKYPALTEADLARVAIKNYAHARLNPLAQMRDAHLDFAAASTESPKNWRIADSPLKLSDCSQITDGAAAVVLCSERFLDGLRVAGCGLRVAGEARRDAGEAMRDAGDAHANRDADVRQEAMRVAGGGLRVAGDAHADRNADVNREADRDVNRDVDADVNREAFQGLAPVRLLGWGHSTDALALDKKDVPAFPHARAAVRRALAQAGIHDPRVELHGAEVHDCFSISEVIAYEVIGLADPGEGRTLLHNGATALPGVRARLLGEDAPAPPFCVPVNCGGGLMADGHPVGATGVRQVLDAYCQLTGQAGASQIARARRFLTYNVGGSMTTTVAMVWGT